MVTPSHRERVKMDCSSALGSGDLPGLGALLSGARDPTLKWRQEWRELPARAKPSFLCPFHFTSGGSTVFLFPGAVCHVARAVPEFPCGEDVGIHCTVGMGKTPALQTHIKVCSSVLGSQQQHLCKSMQRNSECRNGI